MITSRDRKRLSALLSTPWRTITVTADGPLQKLIEAIVEREVQRRLAPKDTYFCTRCDEDHERELYLAHKDV